MLLRIVDVETTGLPPDCKVVEIGWCDVHSKDGVWIVDRPSSMLINPGIPIPAVASAVHHLVDEDVQDALPLSEAIAAADLVREDVFAYVAHRAKFEQAVLPLGDVNWICSWKVAITLAPNMPSHSNQALRYLLKLNVDRAVASPPHRAGPDAYVTAHLIARALAKITPEQMVALSAVPALLPKFHFGKHAGVSLNEVPSDYLSWVVENIKDDEDVAHTARAYLAERRLAQRSRSPV